MDITILNHHLDMEIKYLEKKINMLNKWKDLLVLFILLQAVSILFLAGKVF